jgi:hypothetical protein
LNFNHIFCEKIPNRIKGYRDENFTKFTRAQGVGFIGIKRKNMIKDEKERKVYRFLIRIMRIINNRINRDNIFAISD